MGLDPRFAFWRLPRRVERLAIHVLVLDEQLAQLGQTVGSLVAEKRVARDAELNGAYLQRRNALGLLKVDTEPQAEEQHGA